MEAEYENQTKISLTVNFTQFEVDYKHPEKMLAWPEIIRVLNEFDDYLRSKLKYEELTEDANKALFEARDRLWEILKERNLTWIKE